MNARLKFYLVISLFKRNKLSRTQAGFSLPMAMMTGMMMLAVGTSLLIQSQSNQLKVVAQNTTARAASVAEAGATQYMNFLNKNRALLTFPDCAGTRDSNGTCSDSGTTQSWALASNIPGVNTTSSEEEEEEQDACSSSNNSSNTASEISTNWANTSNSAWKDLPDGQYRLVSYQYSSTKGAGTLTIEARVNQQGTGASATDVAGQTAKARVAMTFPVTASSTPSSVPTTNPGLWARSFSTGATTYANVLDSSGCGSGNTAFSASVGTLPTLPIGSLPNGNQTPSLSTTAATITRQAIPFPSLPPYPTTSQFTTLVNANKVNEMSSCDAQSVTTTTTTTRGRRTTTTSTTTTSFPQNGDYDSEGNLYNSSSPPSTSKTYLYRITGNCTLPSDTTFGSTGQEKIVMYVDGTLDIGNNAKLGTGTNGKSKVLWLLKTSNLDLGGNSQVGSADPTAETAKNWAFFLYGGTSVSLRGTPDYYAFIFAPNATADMRGNPKLAGSLWVNSYQTNGAPPKVFQALTQSDLNQLFSDLYSATSNTSTSTPTNQIGSVGSWQRVALP
jgi:hypothetical protein